MHAGMTNTMFPEQKQKSEETLIFYFERLGDAAATPSQNASTWNLETNGFPT